LLRLLYTVYSPQKLFAISYLHARYGLSVSPTTASLQSLY